MSDKYVCRECHEDYEQLGHCCILETPSDYEAIWEQAKVISKEVNK